ncbi:unnamed protein product, partial [Ectocarpus sp. 13 AM-2016]
ERTVFVANLPFQASPCRVRQVMSRVGIVSSVELETMTTTGMHNGRGVVVYECAKGVRDALRAFNDKTMVIDARLVAVSTTKWPTVGHFAGEFNFLYTFQVARERENALMELSQLGASLGGNLVQAWPAPPGAVVLACSTLVGDGDGDGRGGGGGGGSGGDGASSGGGGGGYKKRGRRKGRNKSASVKDGPPTKRARGGGGGAEGDGRTIAVGRVSRRTTKKELREHFETVASVEAVILLMGKGKLPQEGYVTFTTQAGASKAAQYLDGS